jgi:hypothetical protein
MVCKLTISLTVNSAGVLLPTGAILITAGTRQRPWITAAFDPGGFTKTAYLAMPRFASRSVPGGGMRMAMRCSP